MLNFKLGAQYQVMVERQGEIVESTPFIDNLILDNSSKVMSTGFTEQPIPVIGASNKSTQPNQNGALDPILGLSVINITPSVLSFTSPAMASSGTVKWDYEVKYQYKEDGDNIHEIAIDNFSRMIITDVDNKPYGITVNTNDVVYVKVRFTMTIIPVKNTLALVDKAAVLPNGDYPINFHFDLSHTDPRWWMLFSGFDVKYIQTINDIESSSKSSSVNGRQITILDHFKPDDYFCYGFKFSSALLGDNFMITKFDTPIDFIDGQEFDTVSVIQW